MAVAGEVVWTVASAVRLLGLSVCPTTYPMASLSLPSLAQGTYQSLDGRPKSVGASGLRTAVLAPGTGPVSVSGQLLCIAYVFQRP